MALIGTVIFFELVAISLVVFWPIDALCHG
jgi:hypothetical protein